MDCRNETSSSNHSRGVRVVWRPTRPRTSSLSTTGTTSSERVPRLAARNRTFWSKPEAATSSSRIGFLMSTRSESCFKSSGITVPRLEGTSLEARHSWLMRNSLAEVSWITSQRSTFIMRPSSETMTFRKRSRLMAPGRVIARRLIIPSRASCILILRSNERDCALFDMSNRLGRTPFEWSGS